MSPNISSLSKEIYRGFHQGNNMNQIHHDSQIPNGHILVVACPLQGHAAPLMKLSHQITKFGAKVTFLTKSAHMTSSTTECESLNNGIRVISIHNDLELKSGREDQGELHQSVKRVMLRYVTDFVDKTNQSLKIGDRISGVILDSPLAWIGDVPKKIGLKTAVYWCSSPGCLALGLKIPLLVESKFIDDDGNPLKNEKVHLLPNLPPMAPTDLNWYFPSDTNKQASMFHFIKGVIHHMMNADWILCNWFHELHPSSHDLTPKVLSVGPLLANGQSAGSLYSEDSTCLAWLDKQPNSSVVYVAFGSTSRFTQQQLDELALGLELMGRPFLWVANSSLMHKPHNSYSYEERVGDRGKIVEWAPQEVVLGHPSIACFITHCGWGSFMESASMGVPLLCWPYFGDQLYTRTCVCESSRVGLWLKPNENGIVSRNEINKMVDKLLCDGVIRENALRSKEMARESISQGGSSWVNIEYLVKQMKY